jgi:hypothetical protein
LAILPLLTVIIKYTICIRRRRPAPGGAVAGD